MMGKPDKCTESRSRQRWLAAFIMFLIFGGSLSCLCISVAFEDKTKISVEKAAELNIVEPEYLECITV
jgi:hypothetical protein